MYYYKHVYILVLYIIIIINNKARHIFCGDSREKPREMGQESTNGKIVG